jgi:hypothetical protein
MWLVLVVVLTLAWSAPAGVLMIYSAALEGFLCAIAVFAIRNRLRARAFPHEDEGKHR